MMHSASGLQSLASKRARSCSSAAMYELPAYCKLEPIRLSSSETTTFDWLDANSCWVDFSRMEMVGFALRRPTPKTNGEEGERPGDVGDFVSGEGIGGVVSGSWTSRRESIQHGGLFSSREREMHHDPGRG